MNIFSDVCHYNDVSITGIPIVPAFYCLADFDVGLGFSVFQFENWLLAV
jgi:hypothetical protein